MKKNDPIAAFSKIAAAAEHAAKAMTKLSGKETIVAASTTELITIEEALKDINDVTRASAIVVIKIQGDIQGLLLFSIDPASAQVVIQDAIKQLTAGTYTDHGQTVFYEIANIIAGAMLSSMAKLLNLQLEQSPPTNTTDLLDPFLAGFDTSFTKVLVQQNVFVISTRAASLNLLVIIDPKSTDRMLKKGKEPI